MMAAARHADDVVDLHFAAGAHAQIAGDAGVEIDRHGRVAAIGRRALVAREAALLELHAVGDLPKLGIGVVRNLGRRLIRQQQFGDHLASRAGAIGLRLHLHARCRRADAACGEYALAFDLDHADAAIAVGAIARIRHVAEMRDANAVTPPGAEDRFAGANVDLLVVHEERAFASVGLIVHSLAAQ